MKSLKALHILDEQENTFNSTCTLLTVSFPSTGSPEQWSIMKTECNLFFSFLERKHFIARQKITRMEPSKHFLAQRGSVANELRTITVIALYFVIQMLTMSHLIEWLQNTKGKMKMIRIPLALFLFENTQCKLSCVILPLLLFLDSLPCHINISAKSNLPVGVLEKGNWASD